MQYFWLDFWAIHYLSQRRLAFSRSLVSFKLSRTEAARSGEVEVIKYLIDEHDVDVNERTNGGHGGTPLFWAEHALHPNHEAIALLRRRGAVAIPPELNG